MREKRGAWGRTVGVVAGSLASAARRGQASAATRVVIYDSAGHATLLRPDAVEHAAIAEAAEALIALARETPGAGRVGEDEGGAEGA